MHTTSGASDEIYFHHNGDFSGDVQINIAEFPELDTRRGLYAVERTEGSHGDVAWLVTIPFADLKRLVAEAVRRKKIENLENASDDELLGLD